MSRPAETDEAFATLISQWQSDHLGWEKHEGVGLLWKEGGYAELVLALHRTAPRAARALAQHLARMSEETDGSGTPRGRLVLDVLDALAIPDLAARRRRFDELDVPEPQESFREALEGLEPPMPKRFARRLEAWLDVARGIEVRTADDAPAAPASLVGRSVHHPKFGRGRIDSVANDTAVVTFETDGTKRLALRFLSLE